MFMKKFQENIGSKEKADANSISFGPVKFIPKVLPSYRYVFPKGEMKWGHNLEKKQQIAIIKHSEAEEEREGVQQ